jgi:hypothetical protein
MTFWTATEMHSYDWVASDAATIAELKAIQAEYAVAPTV